jgi:POT family proton-dependent oligopeptide transporter
LQLQAPRRNGTKRPAFVPPAPISVKEFMPTTPYLSAPVKTAGMPPGVPYIIGNEAAERFSYYGMNSILVVFMTQYLMDARGHLDLMSKEMADAWYHTFVSAVYLLPLLGAILADAVLGKFRVIMTLSIVYCGGHLALALGHTRLGLALGLSLIALGAGGIKPCVSANVGDQFGASNQHLLSRVFSWFYFSINFGSAFSTLLIPWLLEPYHGDAELAARLPSWAATALEKAHGPGLAFGLPGILMLVATVIFWLGRRKFVHIPPVGLKNYAAEIFNRGTLKILGNLLIPVPFAAMFWALWQQNFSSWILQAKNMDRHLFGHEWLPAQIQTVNPIFILVMLPLFSYAIYPAIEKVFRLTPLRKIGLGLFVTAGAFAIVAWIQGLIDAGQKPNIIWQVLAFVVLTAGEVMVSVTHLEFAYTQAPKKLKSLVMCTYLGAISLGNMFTAAVNFFIQNPDKTVKLQGASYFYFFVFVMLGTALLFVLLARFYKGQTYIQDERAAAAA